MKVRVEVTLNVLCDQSEDGSLMREWAHEEDVDQGELGILLRFGRGGEVFVPWSSVARVDMSACVCRKCAPDAIRAS